MPLHFYFFFSFKFTSMHRHVPRSSSNLSSSFQAINRIDDRNTKAHAVISQARVREFCWNDNINNDKREHTLWFRFGESFAPQVIDSCVRFFMRQWSKSGAHKLKYTATTTENSANTAANEWTSNRRHRGLSTEAVLAHRWARRGGNRTLRSERFT